MMTRIFFAALLLGIAVFTQSCSSSSPASSLQCTASGTLVANSGGIMQVDDVTVQVTNGSGPFNITIPGHAPVPVSDTSYSVPGTLLIPTGQVVAVVDTSNNSGANCTISGVTNTGDTNGSTGDINVTISPSATAAVGNQIILSASAKDGSTNASFVFSLAAIQSGVALSQASNTTAYVTSSIAANVVVNVYQYVNGQGSVVASTQVPLTFSGTGSTTGGGTTTGTSSIACTLIPYLPSNRVPQFKVGTPVKFGASSATGEALVVTQWNPGEAWTTAPTFPLAFPIQASYSTTGTKNVQIWARSTTRPDVVCNGGAPWTYPITIVP